jgi:hypothetical protein
MPSFGEEVVSEDKEIWNQNAWSLNRLPNFLTERNSHDFRNLIDCE